MDFITIQSKGLLIADDLHLLGGTTKRGDDSKIGMFGSGWKYAIAYLMRNNIGIEIISGTTKFEVASVPKTYRGMDINIITINGVETSLTDDMGPKWTCWMAMREIVSNAIDEGDFKYCTDASLISKEGYTTINIQATSSIEEMMSNFNNYFSFNRPNGIELFVGDRLVSTLYLKNEMSNFIIYRKGIKCYTTDDQTTYDIDFERLEINESRLAESYDIACGITATMDSNSITSTILLHMLSNLRYLHDIENIYSDRHANIIESFKELVVDGYSFTSDFISKFISSPEGVIIVPDKWYSKLVKYGVIENKLNMIFGKDAPDGFIKYDATFDIEKLRDMLNVFNVNIPIITGMFQEQYESVRTTNTHVYIKYDITDRPLFIATMVLTRLRNVYFRKCIEERISI